MALRLPSRKKLALILIGIIVSWLLFSWQLMPRIFQAQAEKFIAEKTGHHLAMNRPEFNPFELSLRLPGLRLTQPDGKSLLAFRELVVDLSAASLYSGALVFDNIRLDGLEVTAVLLANGKLNWSALIGALQSREKKADSPLPRFDIHRLILSGSRLDFADNRVVPAFATRIEPIDIELTELSSLPDDKGQYRFSARTSSGIRLAWQGEARLDPLAVTGRFNIDEVNLVSLSTYFRDSLPVELTAGRAGMSANYRLGYASGKLEVNLEQMAGRLTGLGFGENAGPSVRVDAIEASGGSFDLAKNNVAFGSLQLSGGSISLPSAPKAMELGSLSIEEVNVNLAAHQATLGRIALNDGHVRITRDARGQINILEALKALSSAAKPKTENAKTENLASPWRYWLEKLELAGFNAAFRDETVTPAAQIEAEEIALGMEGISEDWHIAVPIKASFKTPDGGSFAAAGHVVPGVPTADIQLKLTDLGLKPAQPYLSAAARLILVGGRLSTEGRASYNAQGVSYRGGFALRDLLLNETDTGELFLAWKSLGSRSFEVSQSKLEMAELAVDGLDTKLIINKDKSVSFKRILRPSGAASTAANPPVKPVTQAHAFLVNVDRLRFSRGEMDFADYSLALPFGTRIHDLKGVVAGLSTRPDALGQLELGGQVDEYGVARAVGRIDLMNPTDFTDIKVVFRNIEMSRLTPYSATFAGRRIASGKLSLDLEYKIKQRQLQGKNQLVMDQLILGEKVASPEARDLPLDLAIGILQDSDGRIELGLPISGSLDDPSFSYGGIVWQAIANVLSKIATAPFHALGALFGGDEKFENIAFGAGNAQLTPPEREKLVRLAEVLAKRPALSISVHGVYADTDRVALQDMQLRRTVAGMSGQHLEAGEDPGPVSTRQPKVQKALESLFSDSLGGAELAAFKEGFRRANPGKLEESTAGKLMSGLTGLFREKRILNEQEVAGLKGADFYAVLFERLRDRIMVDDKQLQALAAARGDATAAALKEAGVSADRLSVLAAEKVAANGRDVPVKLVLGTRAPAVTATSAN
ncbi:MAG: DUF748 domain-containing protein [Gallionella sp.]|jgi:hypothetical protein